MSCDQSPRGLLQPWVMWMDANALQAVESNVHLDTQAQMMYHGIGSIGGFCYFLRVQNWLWLDLIRSDVRCTDFAGHRWDLQNKAEWSLTSNCQCKTRLRLRIMPQGINFELQYLIWLVCSSFQGWPLHNNTIWHCKNYYLRILQ